MNKSQIKLAAILFGIFFPVLASTVFFMMQTGTGFGGTTSKGTLISPVLDITMFGMVDEHGEPVFLPFDELVAGIDPADYIPRPWGLIYLGDGNCDETCRERLFFLRQLHVRLGAEVDRLQRYYLTTSSELEPQTRQFLTDELPEMEVGYTNVRLEAILPRGESAETDPVSGHYIYVVDPVGNVMLYFTPENSPEDILSDVDKLLEQSSLG